MHSTSQCLDILPDSNSLPHSWVTTERAFRPLLLSQPRPLLPRPPMRARIPSNRGSRSLWTPGYLLGQHSDSSVPRHQVRIETMGLAIRTSSVHARESLGVAQRMLPRLSVRPITPRARVRAVVHLTMLRPLAHAHVPVEAVGPRGNV